MVTRALIARNQLGVACRHYPDQVEDRRRDLAEAKIADYIERVLAEAPPLSLDQRTRLAELLKPARDTITAARLAQLDTSDGAA
jgi:hypothetical protein